MKRIIVVCLIFFMMIACSEAVTSSQNEESVKSGNECIKYDESEQELCLTLTAEQDFVKVGELLPLTIKITSDRDQPNLTLMLFTAPHNDEILKGMNFPDLPIGEVDFLRQLKFDIKANQPIILSGTVTMGKDSFQLQIAIEDGIFGSVTDSLFVYIKDDSEQAQVYYPGMKFPTPEGRIFEESIITENGEVTVTPWPPPQTEDPSP